jgi:L-ascorbate metabolism protein UlaG (beta-lactamase superfamily)
MKITKFVHSCLLIEMPQPINRTALFDPGVMSSEALPVDSLGFLDDIIITHAHQDHMDVALIKRLVAKFPEVRITAPADAADKLADEGITTTSDASDGIVFFDSPHEHTGPLAPAVEQKGVHYLDLLSDPGDSHGFNETKTILALPMTAPWGATVRAVELALELKPQYVLPIHDWHWRDEARQQMYGSIEKILKAQDITFLKLETGKPVVLDV